MLVISEFKHAGATGAGAENAEDVEKTEAVLYAENAKDAKDAEYEQNLEDAEECGGQRECTSSSGHHACTIGCSISLENRANLFRTRSATGTCDHPGLNSGSSSSPGSPNSSARRSSN